MIYDSILYLFVIIFREVKKQTISNQTFSNYSSVLDWNKFLRKVDWTDGSFSIILFLCSSRSKDSNGKDLTWKKYEINDTSRIDFFRDQDIM